jgi:tetrathionate reductase subunit B
VKVFTFDASRCTGCHACQIGCKDEHCGNDWMPYAKPQPDTGQFWGKLNQTTRGNIPQVWVSYMFRPCMHCTNAPCITACTPGAISRRSDGLVLIDPKKCTGCELCMTSTACPYGVIYFNRDLKLAQKCTGCAHLLDRKDVRFDQPRCVSNCPTQCLKFGEEADFKDVIDKSEVLMPEAGTKPRVYYMNLPKKFIAGTVYDPGTKEVVVGATCTVTGEGQTVTAKTNDWGDFKIDGLKAGKYSLKIEGGGKTKTVADISTQKDVGLGDVALA